jgi:formylglycine-generating enzyme
LSSTSTNSANYYNGGYTDRTNYLTAVGASGNSPSAYGTFDRGGEVMQWNETKIDRLRRGRRGGSFGHWLWYFLSSSRGSDDPVYGERDFTGFRVALVPEPASMALLACSPAC